MNLGYFPDWNGSRTLLLGVSDDETPKLIAMFRLFASSHLNQWLLHTSPEVTAHNGAELHVVKLPARGSAAPQLACGESEIFQVIDLLEGLAEPGTSGHQYFDLSPPEYELVVSQAEYPSSLWESAEKWPSRYSV